MKKRNIRFISNVRIRLMINMVVIGAKIVNLPFLKNMSPGKLPGGKGNLSKKKKIKPEIISTKPARIRDLARLAN